MNGTDRILVTLLIVIVLLVCIGTLWTTAKKKRISFKKSTTKEGYKYSTTCIDGYKMVVTQSSSGSFYVIAGPIGKCE